VLRGYPVLLIGELYGPTERVRQGFSDLRRQVQRHFLRRDIVRDWLRGRRAPLDCALYLATSLPGARSLTRRLLTLNAVLKDPRARGPWEPLLRWREALERSRHGMVPWGQPVTIRTEYPLPGPAWRERRILPRP
jgi:hypothetical protein